MYRFKKAPQTTLRRNDSFIGERIEQKVNRIVNNREPITDSAPLTYTERKDGVNPDHNIRTDKWEVALDGMDYVTRSHLAKREERHNPKPKPDGQAASTQATE